MTINKINIKSINKTIIILAIGAGIGYFSKPAKVVTKIKEKEVIRYVEKKKENKDIIVTEIKTVDKDGNVRVETTVQDRSRTESSSDSSSSRQSSSSKTVSNKLDLSIHVVSLFRDISMQDVEYGIYVRKRVIGNISFGVLGTENKTFGLSIGMDF
jgi:hypothetical protein